MYNLFAGLLLFLFGFFIGLVLGVIVTNRN